MTEKRLYHDNTSKVFRLARWLDDHDYFHSTAEMLQFMERPWRWQREFELHHAYENAASDIELRNLLIDAIDNENATAEHLIHEDDWVIDRDGDCWRWMHMHDGSYLGSAGTVTEVVRMIECAKPQGVAS